MSVTLPGQLWFSPAPRANGEAMPWAKRLVAWLDLQDRRRELIRPVVKKVIDNTTLFLNTNVVCTHSLEQRVFSATVPNVRWILAGAQHSGVGTLAGSTISVLYTTGVVARNTIELRFYAAGFTVDVTNPLTVWLYFFPNVEELAQ